jgi:hypothetical protein
MQLIPFIEKPWGYILMFARIHHVDDDPRQLFRVRQGKYNKVWIEQSDIRLEVSVHSCILGGGALIAIKNDDSKCVFIWYSQNYSYTKLQ